MIGNPDACNGKTPLNIVFNQKPKNARHYLCAAIAGLESDDPEENEEGREDALEILQGVLAAFDAGYPTE